jgi:hypothetical protein
MITIIQVLIIVFALFALSRAILRFRDNRLTVKELILWGAIWLLIIVSSIIPRLTNIISAFFGMGRGLDLAVYVSVILLFYLMFRLYVKTESLEKEVTLLVRKLAIDNKDSSNSKNNKENKDDKKSKRNH